MDFQKIIKDIGEALKKPLPGKDIQLKMSSMRRIRELMDGYQGKNSIRSSVLILLYPDADEKNISTVLIQRPNYEGVHGGQISLPGGRSEDSDKDLTETALREAKEEIGIQPDKIVILGNLTELYIPPSNYLVSPFIGYTVQKPQFYPDLQEVDRIIEIHLSDLLNDDNIKHKEIYVRPGLTVSGPCFEINGFTIWGATAMILNEFREILMRMRI